MANIEQLTSDLSKIEAMSDAELLEYFKDVLHVTRPSAKQRELVLELSGPERTKSGHKSAPRATVRSLEQQAKDLLERANAMIAKNKQQ